ncbi:minor capsid protein [Eubacterium aggregans]
MNDAIKKTVGARWANESNFSERIWKNRKDLAAFLHQDFAQGIARGDSYDHITKQMSKRFSDVIRNRMYTLIYSEGTFIMNEATITPFEDAFEEYEYNTTGDSHVCDICSALNGQEFPIKTRRQGVNFPPMHPRCRCSYLIVVGDDFVDDYVARHGGDKGTPAHPGFGVENVYHTDFTEYDESPETKRGILKARTELDQYFQITGLHSNGKSFIQRNREKKVIAEFTPFELANKVQKQMKDSGKDVKIYACNAGSVGATAAQKLADILGVNVKAPTKLIAYYGNDDTFHAIEVDKKGRIITKYKVDTKWKIFKPRNKKK